MTRVFALCSAVDPTGSVKQFDLALPLLRERLDVVRHVLATGRNGERAARAALAAAGVDILHTLGAEAFRVAHAWATAAVLPGGRKLPPWVAAGAASVEPPLGYAPGLTATISQCEYERDWSARLTPAPMQFLVPVAVTAPPGGVRQPPESSSVRGLTHPAECVVAAGGFDAVANLKHVVWAFDAFRYAHPGAELVLLGDGPQRADLDRYARSLGLGATAVRFSGHQAVNDAHFRSATQVWSTHTHGGTKFLLEAMASGVPVIAARTCDTERVVRDGVNGLLVPIGRPVEMARVAHGLLNSPDRARAISVAGGAEATRYPVADLADALAGVYHTLNSSDPPRSE